MDNISRILGQISFAQLGEFGARQSLAILIHPTLIVELRRFLPLLATIGLASTVGGYWWLWWRPR